MHIHNQIVLFNWTPIQKNKLKYLNLNPITRHVSMACLISEIEKIFLTNTNSIKVILYQRFKRIRVNFLTGH
jgi:hypothetical protein